MYHYSEHFGVKHHKYSDALLDYGFFLLNIDAIAQSVEVRNITVMIHLGNARIDSECDLTAFP